MATTAAAAVVAMATAEAVAVVTMATTYILPPMRPRAANSPKTPPARIKTQPAVLLGKH